MVQMHGVSVRCHHGVPSWLWSGDTEGDHTAHIPHLLTGEINLRFRRGSVNMCGKWICGQRVRLLVLMNTWTTLDDAEKTHSKTKPKISWVRSSPYYKVFLRKNGQEVRSQEGNTVCFFKVSSAESMVLEHSFILFWWPLCYCQATINAVRPFCLKDTYLTVQQIRENNKNKNLFHHSTAFRFFLCIRFFFFLIAVIILGM